MPVFTIDTFRVQNYKPIKDSGHINVGDITTFIGKNDAGKSSFLEAVHLFLDGSKPKDDHFHKREAEKITFTSRLTNLPPELEERLAVLPRFINRDCSLLAQFWP